MALEFIPVKHEDEVAVLSVSSEASADELRDLVKAVLLDPIELENGDEPVGFIVGGAMVGFSAACKDPRLLSANLGGKPAELLVLSKSDREGMPDDDDSDASSVDSAVKATKDDVVYLERFLTALQAQGFVTDRTADAIRGALSSPSHRARFQAAYKAYVRGDVDVVGLRDEITQHAEDIRQGPSIPPAFRQDLCAYISYLESEGFLTASESGAVQARIMGGDRRIAEAYEATSSSQDLAVLHRAIMSIARLVSSPYAPLADSSSDDDDLSGSSSDGEDNDTDEDYEDNDTDEDDEDNDTDVDDEDNDTDEDDDVEERRRPDVSRPGAPTPEGAELMRVVSGMLNDGDISRSEADTLRDLISKEDARVMAAFEVYEEDEAEFAGGEDELRDTLSRIVRLEHARNGPSRPGGAATRASAENGVSESYPTSTLRNLVESLASSRRISRHETSTLEAAISLHEPELARLVRTYFRGGNDFAALEEGIVSFLRRKPHDSLRRLVKDLDDEWPQGLYEDIATAHSALIAEMRAYGKINGAEATSLRRLFAVGDNAVRAAWRVYVHNENKDELEDTMLRIVARENTEQSHETEAPGVKVIDDLENAGLLTVDEAAQLRPLAAGGHQVVTAALEAHAIDGDADELVDTLKLTLWHASRSREEQAPKPSSSAPAGGKVTTWLLKFIDNMRGVNRAEAEALRTLVLNNDPRVLAARDVFVADRNPDDLSDTLSLIARLAVSSPQFASRFMNSGSDDGTDPDQAPAMREPSNAPELVSTIQSVLAHDSVSADTTETVVRLARSADPSVIAAVEVFESTGDADDLRDTLERIAHRAEGLISSPSAAGRAGGKRQRRRSSLPPELRGEPPSHPLTDGDRDMLQHAIHSMDLPEAEEKEMLKLVDVGDELMIAAAEVYNTEKDMDDLMDTLGRLHARVVSLSTN